MERIDHNGTILKVRLISSEVIEVVLHCPAVALSAKPGQFVMLRLRGVLDPLLGRPFAIAATEAETVTLLVQVVGKFTHLLKTLPPGTKANLRGPMGNGYLERPSDKKIIFVAGTVGAAPFFLPCSLFLSLRKGSLFLEFQERAGEVLSVM